MTDACANCLHGYDVGIKAGSPVYCAPKNTNVPANYVCTGHQAITQDDIEKRRKAIFGLPRNSTKPSS